MRQIEFFGRFWTVKFDTDKPLDVKETEKLNRTQLSQRLTRKNRLMMLKKRLLVFSLKLRMLPNR